MPPDPWYLDADASLQVLERIVLCIDAQTRPLENQLLEEFLLTEWPSVYAQIQ